MKTLYQTLFGSIGLKIEGIDQYKTYIKVWHSIPVCKDQYFYVNQDDVNELIKSMFKLE